MKTFIRFNYRTIEPKMIAFDHVHHKLFNSTDSSSGQKIMFKGSMNISELWSEKNLQELIGSLPFPKDRLKILNSYQQNKSKLIRIRRKKKYPEPTLKEALEMCKIEMNRVTIA